MVTFSVNDFKKSLKQAGLSSGFVNDEHGYVICGSDWYSFLWSEFLPSVSGREFVDYGDACEFLKRLDYVYCGFLFGELEYKLTISKVFVDYSILSFSAMYSLEYNKETLIHYGKKYLEIYDELMDRLNNKCNNVRVDVGGVDIKKDYIDVKFVVSFCDRDGKMYDRIDGRDIVLEFCIFDLVLTDNQEAKLKLFCDRFVSIRYVEEAGFDWLNSELIISRVDKCINTIKNGLKILRECNAH